jgi:hypothetical protein
MRRTILFILLVIAVILFIAVFLYIGFSIPQV